MRPVIQFLTENPVVYFASCDKNHQPHVRPFQFMLEQEGKLYFCTSMKKTVYKEIRYNPLIELSTCDKNNRWIRVGGRAVFTEDDALKVRILAENPLVQSIYKTPDNPDFVIFYLAEPKAAIADLSGNPPQYYRWDDESSI